MPDHYNYNDNVKTNYVDTPVTACPVCSRAVVPTGCGVNGHLQKHVREGKLTQTEKDAMLRRLRGVPEGM